MSRRRVARPRGRGRLGAAVSAVLTLWAACAECVAHPSPARPAVDGQPTVVHVGVFIVDLDAVNSTDQSFTANVYVEARWRDPSLAGNEAAVFPLEQVWHPRLQLLNQREAASTLPEVVEVQPDGQVTYRQRIWGAFSQPMNLRQFPFDRQHLDLQIVAAGYTPDAVRIVALADDSGARSGVAEGLALPEWSLAGFEAEPVTVRLAPQHPGMPALRVRMVVDRHWDYYLFKAILPLCLIVFMSWTVFWIDPTEVEANVSVSVTAVLTVIAYRFAILEALPKVSYLTRMEAFVTVATIIVFLSVIQVVYNARLAKEGLSLKALRNDKVSRVAFPLAFVLSAAAVLAWL